MNAQKGVVRIFDHSNEVIGAGILLANNHIATSAYVISDALRVPLNESPIGTTPVQLDFPFSEENSRFQAEVVIWQVDDDIAVLKLETDAPSDIKPTKLARETAGPGTIFRTIGFPHMNKNGVWAAGKVLGFGRNGSLQLISDHVGPSIRTGFWGAPIITRSGNVVGIIIARELAETIYAMPASRIARMLPDVAEPLNDCPIVFLCHASEDKNSVREIHKKLSSDGFASWFDEVDLLPGQKWDAEIRKAVKKAHAILVCMSNNSITKRGYVQKEIKFALDVADEQPEDVIFIIPARLEKCSVPARLAEWHWVDLFDTSGYTKLVEALNIVREANCQ